MISKKDPLVGKFDLLIKLVHGILHKCGKILKRKDRANILCHLESCHVANKCLVSLDNICPFPLEESQLFARGVNLD